MLLTDRASTGCGAGSTCRTQGNCATRALEANRQPVVPRRHAEASPGARERLPLGKGEESRSINLRAGHHARQLLARHQPVECGFRLAVDDEVSVGFKQLGGQLLRGESEKADAHAARMARAQAVFAPEVDERREHRATSPSTSSPVEATTLCPAFARAAA